MSPDPSSLSTWKGRDQTMMAYAAFLHYDELSKLRCCDVEFCADHMMVHIVSSKTDQYREGARLTVAHTGLPTCPVPWQSCGIHQKRDYLGALQSLKQGRDSGNRDP